MRIKNYEQNTLTLNNFEGPLSFLVYLVQKSEIDLSEISVFEITEQYLQFLASQATHDLDAGADFIDYTSLLIWLKSKMLIPNESLEEDLLELAEQLPFDILPQLIEYCRFKKVAKELSHREEGRLTRFRRGHIPTPDDFPKPLGIERISLEELQELFKDLLEKSETQKGVIQEEEWRVSDKIHHFRTLLQAKGKVRFIELFSENPCKNELIVTFLGMLELMKIGELDVLKEENQLYVVRCDGTGS